MENSPKEIKTKMKGVMLYTLTHWPQDNFYVIHQYDTSNDGTGVGHLSPEIASFRNEKEAIEYFDAI